MILQAAVTKNFNLSHSNRQPEVLCFEVALYLLTLTLLYTAVTKSFVIGATAPANVRTS